ncbi:MAG: S1C family serine protease [Candidatus Micrarchaeia archaeon]|jgi:S1-C subfamily serine protease
MAKNYRLLTGFAVILLLLLGGCAFLFTDTQEISKQDSIIASNMASANALLMFQEQATLNASSASYQSTSNAIGAACAKLDELDSGKTYRSKDSKVACENRKGLDNCFFQVEKIRVQISKNDATVNLDSLDVLCSDLRSMGQQGKLDTFKSQYQAYAAWLKSEDEILADWNSISMLFWNSTYEPQPSNAKLSDFYKSYSTDMAGAKADLQGIKAKCESRNDYKATNPKIDKICSNVDDYLSDMEKVNTAIFDTLDFFSAFESGTVTVNTVFIRDCYQVNKDFVELYDLELLKDTKLPDSNESDLASMCASFEELGSLYGSLGIPLIFQDGELSSTTKTELLKAKTVYVETAIAIGSGVIIDSDDDGYYILTNAHVALEYDPYTGSNYLPSYVRIKFYDGKAGYATSVGYDQEGYDFALLYVPSSGAYPTASYYEDYYPNAGDKVVAVGNPYGLAFSTSQGTVSAVRDIGCDYDYCYGISIQTDTAVNPGNSGGGLWDYETGDLLGITSLGLTQAEGLNFAISMYQYGLIKDTFKWYYI